MINNVLAFWAPGPYEIIIILILFGIPVLLVLLIVLFIRYILRSKKESLKLRLEVGKLTDEVEQVRKKLNLDKEQNSSGESG